MRRTTVWFGKRGQNRRFKEGELLGNEGARVSSSEISVPSFAVFSQNDALLPIHRTYGFWNP
jgi:hypothetical protein